MDIEGAEELFLKGANRLLRDIRIVLYIEVNEKNQNLLRKHYFHPAIDFLESLKLMKKYLSNPATLILSLDLEKYKLIPRELCRFFDLDRLALQFKQITLLSR